MDKKTSMYPKLFDDVLKQIKITSNIQKIISIFNEEIVDIDDFYDDALLVLKKLKEKYKLGIITDGNVSRQKNKIKKAGIDKIVNLVVYTENFSPKPSTLSFKYAINSLMVPPSETVYVADNPKIDFIGAKKMGMKTIRILQGEFVEVPSDKYVDYTIKQLNELLEIVKNWKEKL